MKKSFAKKLAAYTGAAGAFIALGSANEAKAQAVYTDVNPDEVLDPVNFDNYEIDFNNDAISEFEIKAYYYFTYGTSYNTYYGTTNTWSFKAKAGGIYRANPNFGVIGINNYYYYGIVDALNQNHVISNTSIFNAYDFIYNLGYNTFGPFTGTGDKYIGVHFDIGADTHYGWILINVESNFATIAIKGFAYESQPGVGIMAGDTVGVYMNLTAVSSIQTTSANAEYWPSKTGTAYYVVQLATDPVPNKNQVKAGTGATGATVANSGNAATIENIASQFAVTGLTQNTQYKIYSVIESNTILSNVKTLDFTTETSNINELFADEFSAFPSPADDIINVQMPSEGKIAILDLKGKVIFSTQQIAGTNQIDVSALASGMYFIHYTDIQGNNQMVKFVKN